MKGVNVTVMNGYPAADANGIITATQMDPTSERITISSGASNAGDLIKITVNVAKAGSCMVTDQTSAAADRSPGVGSNTAGY
jgi:hypothetical protein